MKDYDEYLDDRLEGMYSILESSDNELMEGFFQRMKEKHAVKKLERQTKKRNKLLNEYPLISKCKKLSVEDEFDDVVDKIVNIIKREVPGAPTNRKISHYTKDLGSGYTLHEFSLNILSMSDRDKRRFINNGNNTSLKTMLAANDAAKVAKAAKDVYDIYDNHKRKDTEEDESAKEERERKKRATDAALYAAKQSTDISDLLKEEIYDRLLIPMISHDFEATRYSGLIRYKDNKEFINIKHSYHGVYIYMTYIINEEEIVEEGFLANLKEKRAAKKAAKEEKRAKDMLDETLLINRNKLPVYEKEYNKLVKDMMSLLKREIPGCAFSNTEPKHSSTVVAGYEFHRFHLSLFYMDDDNFIKFKNKSKNEELRNAENTWDAVDELIQDTFERIGKPLESKGFSYDENRVYSKAQGGKEYIFVDLGDEAAFDVDIFMTVAIEKE